MAKNKQLVFTLHEGCLAPDAAIVKLAQEVTHTPAERALLMFWLRHAIVADTVILDKVEVIDCDCEVE